MAKRQITKVVRRGGWGTVEYAIRPSSKVPAEEDLLSFEQVRDKNTNGRAKFLALFDLMAKNGPTGVPPKRFKREMDEFHAFSVEIGKVQLRFPCFLDGRRWILTHGFKKPGAQSGKGKWPQSEIDKAKEIRGEYYESKRQWGD